MIEVKYGKRKVVNYRGRQMVVGGLTAKNKIDILLYITREFANTREQDELFNRVMTLGQEIFECDNLTLRLWNGEKLKPVKYLVETDPPRRDLDMGEGFSGRVLETREARVIQDLRGHPEMMDPGETTRSVVCVPILYKENVLGTLAIEKDIPGFYKDDDQELLEAMSSQLALALNEVRLIEGLIDAQTRINNDLKMGRTVQAMIIPHEIPSWNGMHLAYYYEPMVEVSGDYFDVARKETSLSVLIADVSGHGVSAALVTVTIHHEFQRCVEWGMGLPETMEHLSEKIRPKLPVGTYFTAQIIRIYNDHSFSYVNAGHPRILHHHVGSGSFDFLDAKGMPLGIVEATRKDYEEKYGTLAPGDVLVLLTDGFTEQRDDHGQETGLEKMLDWFRSERVLVDEKKPGINFSREMLEALVSRWKKHVQGTSREDDLTMIMLQLNPEIETARDLHRRARIAVARNEAEARSMAEEAHAVEPSLSENLMLLARLSYRSSDLSASGNYLQNFTEVTGERSPQISQMLGNIAYQSGNSEEAKRQYKNALAADHAFSEASLMLARCYLKTGEQAKALKTLRIAVRSNPGNTKVKQALEALESQVLETMERGAE